MVEEDYDHGYYVAVEGYGDDIEAWATAHGLTLDMALDEGVWSPDEGGDCVMVPADVYRMVAK